MKIKELLELIDWSSICTVYLYDKRNMNKYTLNSPYDDVYDNIAESTVLDISGGEDGQGTYLWIRSDWD